MSGVRASAKAAEPDRAAPGFPILRAIGQYREAVSGQQPAVFLGRKAGVIERIAAAEAGDRFAVAVAAGEHEQARGCGQTGERGKHRALVLEGQMKEAVPGDDAVETVF